MSHLASLRTAGQGNNGRLRGIAYVLAVLALLGIAWWLLPVSHDGHKAQSQFSPNASFRPAAQRLAPPTPKLQISAVVQNGQVVEIKGTADCNASLMINGERVPLIFEHCGFKHFMLLPDGPSTVAVTAQGPAGGVNTQLVKVNVQ